MSSDDDKTTAGIDCMDYSPSLHLLAVALADGRCAILRAGRLSFETHSLLACIASLEVGM